VYEIPTEQVSKIQPLYSDALYTTHDNKNAVKVEYQKCNTANPRDASRLTFEEYQRIKDNYAGLTVQDNCTAVADICIGGLVNDWLNTFLLKDLTSELYEKINRSVNIEFCNACKDGYNWKIKLAFTPPMPPGYVLKYIHALRDTGDTKMLWMEDTLVDENGKTLNTIEMSTDIYPKEDYEKIRNMLREALKASGTNEQAVEYAVESFKQHAADGGIRFYLSQDYYL
jgi:hypothetical protein